MHACSLPLHSPDFYAGDPYPAYRELRATAPVCWNDVTNFWALLKYEDIRFVSSSPAMFTSTKASPSPTRRCRTRCKRATSSSPTHRGTGSCAS